MKLKIADSLSFPLDAVTQALAFLGRRGSGKSYAATKLAELFFDAGAQFVAIDPVGIWWGLRLAADGKSKGLDLPIFGGLNGDVPLEATAGALIADVIVNRGTSAVLDVSQFESDADKARFANDFAARFFFLKKANPSAVHVFVEEAQEFIPQNIQKGEEKMLHSWQRMIRLGRNYGIGVSMISQRPQDVNKKALNQAECLFCFQLTGPQERKAVEGWVSERGLSENLDNILPHLKRGHAHLWSPVWLDVNTEIVVSEKRTFSAGTTPVVGAKPVKAVGLEPLELEQIRKDMAATVERAKENDPRELKRKIADLQRQLTTKPAVQIDEKAVSKAVETALAQREREHKQEIASYQGLIEKMQTALTSIGESAARFVNIELPKQQHKPIEIELPVAPRPRASNVRFPPSRPVERVTGGKLRAGAERMLAALVQWHPNGMREGQMRAHAGMKKSGTFSTYMSDLRTGGYIEVTGDTLTATQAGLDYFGGNLPDAPRTTEEVLAIWEPKLREGARRILRVLVSRKGHGMDLETLADASGMTKSGTFSTYLSDLRTARLIITERGQAKANTETLFL